MKIVSNYKPRRLFSFNELNRSAQAEFDYVLSNEHNDLNEPRFFYYRGDYYDTAGFASLYDRNTTNSVFDEFLKHGFDAYITDSYFSGILISWFDKDGNPRENNVIVGRFFD